MAVHREPIKPKRKEFRVVERKSLKLDPHTIRRIADIFSTITDLIREQRAKLKSTKIEDAKSLLIVQLFRINPELQDFLTRLEIEDRESYVNLIDAIKTRIDDELRQL
jgi:hypothetical protein